MRPTLELLTRRPAQVARWCGLDKLSDTLHNAWMQQMILGKEDMTLLAHRGSYKTTCLAVSMAIRLLVYPAQNILFLRKTDDDVIEVLRQVKRLLACEALQLLSARIYGHPVRLARSDMFSVTTDCYTAPRGAPQLLGQGTRASLTGKHADIIFTDDIVNTLDRSSSAERLRIRSLYQELQNIRNPGGRIVNTATPWHPGDAVSLMPHPQRFDCHATGLLTPQQIDQLRQSMSPALFAANYELRHIAADDALISTPPRFVSDPALLRDGIAHIDAAYGGGDYTALTCGQLGKDGVILYGRLWRRPLEDVTDEILAECRRLLCGPIHIETNGDKGYAARELRRRGAMVRTYQEQMNKQVKIAAYLRKWWPRVLLLEGTDRAWIDQLLDYTDHAEHDDAPDSAACLLRLLERRAGA